MTHRIEAVLPGSIAEECGLRPGDELIAIDDSPVQDQIDYQAMTATDTLVLTVRMGGEVVDIELEKDEDEALGLTFGSTLMSQPRVCANRCKFCFIDQMPKGLRDTLYVKDDDWRLSLMMGNYITLTNLSQREMARIIARRASPLYISVHVTDGAIRASLMGNANANRILPQLQRLSEAGIRFHCQIVLCPGINDGEVLDRTLGDLLALSPAALSAALVPVGLTRHREGLAELVPFTREGAKAVLAQARAWQQRFQKACGTAFVFPADEFYCIAGEEIPPYAAYEDFPQIENGVGLFAQFKQDYVDTRKAMDATPKPARYLIATGTSAAPQLDKLLMEAPVPGVTVQTIAVKNHFFGETVTVAGLITGQDLVSALRDVQGVDAILIPGCMLRQGGDRFLDDMTLAEVQEKLPVPLRVIPPDGASLCETLYGLEEIKG